MNITQQFTEQARKFFYARRTKHRTAAIVGLEATRWGRWTRLGNGFYGEAWMHDEFPEFVIKISGCAGWGYDFANAPWSMNDDGGEPRADVWPRFAAHCQENPHPNLPKVHHLEHVAGFAWGVLTRYEPEHQSYNDDEITHFREAMRQQRQAEYWMLPLLDIALGAHVAVDLHAGNIMYDSESGKHIIIDPFSSTGSRQYTAQRDCTDRTDYNFGTDDESSSTEGEETC